ncbi:pentapeptide repeat-containing protein [Kitasatospora sp. NBC_00240]|uniref:pentapeptide repeat-containing protein n=1 Tax=Kitasatospora sp. NBC_00240 TaxID=2903567 RepID=UPI00224E41C0|nr:pentapeptide repeat-containing protein [Kitasatospora sp. NBC_00240]MCX5212769.1 pentapeptide repeat-containing protein [Kitasatospora sp. NBC_00240]
MPSSVPDQFDDLPYGHLLRPHDGPLRRDERYDTVHFDGGEYTDQAASGASFLECAFTAVAMSGVKLRQARFNEVWVQGSRWVACDLSESEWQDASVLGGVLAGVAAHGSALRRVVLRQCKLESVNLRAAVLRDVVFEDCVLRDVDFGDAKLTGVTFPGSTLEDVRLRGAKLSKTDLRGAVRLGLSDGHEGLRGALISSTQLFELAPQFAQALGITVKDR